MILLRILKLAQLANGFCDSATLATRKSFCCFLMRERQGQSLLLIPIKKCGRSRNFFSTSPTRAFPIVFPFLWFFLPTNRWHIFFLRRCLSTVSSFYEGPGWITLLLNRSIFRIDPLSSLYLQGFPTSVFPFSSTRPRTRFSSILTMGK